jgi:hypothetical protein
MTKVEARMTKEGRMTKIERKGGSDFGLRASFVIRASSFGIRHYNTYQRNREVFGAKKHFSSRKTTMRNSSNFGSPEKRAENGVRAGGKYSESLENGTVLVAGGQ